MLALAVSVKLNYEQGSGKHLSVIFDLDRKYECVLYLLNFFFLELPAIHPSAAATLKNNNIIVHFLQDGRFWVINIWSRAFQSKSQAVAEEVGVVVPTAW